MNLDELRNALTDLDGQLVELVARRQALSEQVAAVKRSTGRATRDFGREREVILRGRNTASRLGVSPDLAESLLRQLIQSSLATQEHARVAAQAHGSGKRALVIGGHGKMGGWFADFLASQGFRVAIADPKGALPGFDGVADWQNDPLDFDLIVLATPLSATTGLLERLAQRRPRGARCANNWSRRAVALKGVASTIKSKSSGSFCQSATASNPGRAPLGSAMATRKP